MQPCTDGAKFAKLSTQLDQIKDAKNEAEGRTEKTMLKMKEITEIGRRTPLISKKKL